MKLARKHKLLLLVIPCILMGYVGINILFYNLAGINAENSNKISNTKQNHPVTKQPEKNSVKKKQMQDQDSKETYFFNYYYESFKLCKINIPPSLKFVVVNAKNLYNTLDKFINSEGVKNFRRSLDKIYKNINSNYLSEKLGQSARPHQDTLHKQNNYKIR